MLNRISKLSKKIILSFIDFAGGLIDIAIDPYETIKYGDKAARIKLTTTLNNLTRCGYINRKKTKDRYHYNYFLTNKGKKAALFLSIEDKIKKRKKWDKKWRILIFDIPENKRRYRQTVRNVLRDLGFFRLQKSVWVFPYDVKEYLYNILPGFREGDWFEYIVADKISSQVKIKKHFGLK